MQPQPRGQLLGVLKVRLQRVGQALALDGHDALVALRALIGFQGDGEIAVAHEIANFQGAALIQVSMAGQTSYA